MTVALPGQLNLDETLSWGSRSVDFFEKIEQIGEGTYGQVYMAREKATGEVVALKKVRMDNEKEGFPITAIREIKILKKLQHENVIKLKEIVTSKGPEKEDQIKPGEANKFKGSIYMVFEYMDHDLTGLSDRPGMRFSVPQIKCYMRQLLTGLHYCHVNQVLHRDIKGSNLLIDNNGNLKLADFGLARSFSSDQNGQPLTNRVITLWYRPPELLMGSTRYTPAVDMWSVGCIFAELLHGKPILPGKNETEQMQKIADLCAFPDETNWPGVSKLPFYKTLKPDRPTKRRVKDVFKSFDRHALELLERMLTLDPECRISAKDALDAEYFWTEPFPCLPSSLPKYEASHEYQTKKKRQQKRQQQEEAAKRQKTMHQAPPPHTRLPPIQQQQHIPALPLRPGPNQQAHNLVQGTQHYGNTMNRGAGGNQGRAPGSGRPPHGGSNLGGGYGPNWVVSGGGGGYGGPVGGYTAPNMGPQAGRGYGAPPSAGGRVSQGVPYGGMGGNRGPSVGGCAQQFGSMNGGVSQQTGYGGQPYMQQPTAQYVDIDGAYANASNSGFPPPSPHRPDYRQPPH
ncbi:unnamed protein product [Sphagnum jensenii]|uniref:Protein kinase domain-containing protein n=1 Tax=Sphagnum jensenii TaxID=128206 RepID=A0ABP1ABG4_9BRYO